MTVIHRMTPAGALVNQVVDDETPTLGGQLDAANNKIVNLAAGTADNDAVRKVDVILQEEKDVANGVPTLNENGVLSGTIVVRNDTAANINATTPVQGEPVWKTDTKVFAIGDDSTAGGFELTPGIGSLIEDTSPELGGDLRIDGYKLEFGNGETTDGEIQITDGYLDLGGGVGYVHLRPASDAACRIEAGDFDVTGGGTAFHVYAATGTDIDDAIVIEGVPTIIVIRNLPTSEPAQAGQLWDDNGTLKIVSGGGA